MALAGVCISRSGIDIALVSGQDGALQDSANMPVQQIAPVALDADILLAPYTPLASQHPAELTVLAISTQVRAGNRFDELPEILNTDDERLTIDYIDAYITGLEEDHVASAPCFLFIEITATVFTAQLGTIRFEGTERIRVPVHVEAATSTSTTTLPTFVGQVFAWAPNHNHKLSQYVFLDPPSGLVDFTALQTALAPDCPIITVDGVQLAKYAASYAFLNFDGLRQSFYSDNMGQYWMPSPISFMVNNGPPTLIIHSSEQIPAAETITFTTSEENQTSVVVEFAHGMHDARPDDRLIFAKVTLEGLHPGQRQITVFAFISRDMGNTVEVFQGTDRQNADVRAVLQIPYPYIMYTYGAIEHLLPSSE